jgi:hypothetical protein
MSLLAAVTVFVVGFLSGVVVRRVAGLAAVVALVLVALGITSVDVSVVDAVVRNYYLGNELLFLSGLLFGIDAGTARTVVVERRRSGS